MYFDLSMAQVNCSLVADAEAGYYVNEVDCILSGAEVVLNDGSIINRTGTALIALCAKDANKPLIIFAECYKFINKTLLTQKDIPNFARYDSKRKEPIILTDLTKSKYISLFCTDVGCVAP
jgi:translation initiation factor eIF-2B subunit alpha